MQSGNDPSTRPGSERRGLPRVTADLSVQLNLDSGATNANLRDISLSGVCCITERAMPVMTQVQLTIVLPDAFGDSHPVTCAGAVVRSEPVESDDGDRSEEASETGPDGSSQNGNARFETAIFFTHMGEAERSNLEDFVELRRSVEAAAQNDEG